jgi:hypothetical protein
MLAGNATARSVTGIAAAGSVAIVAAHRTAAPNICLRISFSFLRDFRAQRIRDPAGSCGRSASKQIIFLRLNVCSESQAARLGSVGIRSVRKRTNGDGSLGRIQEYG